MEYDSKVVKGSLNWTIRNDLSRASCALMMKDVPEMNHMIAVLRGYRNGKRRRRREVKRESKSV